MQYTILTPSLRTTKIAHNAVIQTHPKESYWKDIIPPQYHDFKDIFTRTTFNQKLPEVTCWAHKIELTPSAEAMFLENSKLPINQ